MPQSGGILISMNNVKSKLKAGIIANVWITVALL